MPTLQTRLDTARKDLLDLSLRNKLLNYLPLKAKGVEIVDELPPEILRILVLEGKPMSFLPRAEEADTAVSTAPAAADADSLGQPIENGALADRHQDTRLQTPHTSAELQKRLLNTFYTARLSVEEQGVNVLYLALGMLRWREAESSSQDRLAPLVLVPVELDRKSAQTRFRVRHTGDDVGENLSLRTKLRTDFGIELPPLPDVEDLDVNDYFAQVATAVQSLPDWRVDAEAIVLGFFSFSTFLIYSDLNAANWPNGSGPESHPLLQSILGEGFAEPPPAVDDDAQLDAHVSPSASSQVVDADSSQTLAILDAKQGRNLVIQGPPGTGKSQTITNLVAEALGDGKTVLFVAEKLAALEVVKRRLDSVGLGAACLELHSNKANKKALLSELQRTLELGRPKLKDYTADLRALIAQRKRLNAYSEAVNTPVDRSGVTPYRAYGRLLQLSERLQGVSAPQLDSAAMDGWDSATFRTWHEQAEALQALAQRTGPLSQHLFWGSGVMVYLPADGRALQAACDEATAAITRLRDDAMNLADALDLPHPTDRATAVATKLAAQRTLHAPDLTGIDVTHPAWTEEVTAVHAGLQAATRLVELHDTFDDTLLPEAWNAPVLPIRTAYANYGSKWWRILSGDFRRARRELNGLTQSGLPDGVGAQMALIEAILEAQRQAPILAKHADLLQTLLGVDDPLQTDWPRLADAAGWLLDLHAEIAGGTLPAEIAAYLGASERDDALQARLEAVEAALEQHDEALAGVIAQLQLDESARFGPDSSLHHQPLAAQLTLLQAWHANAPQLADMATFNQMADRLREAKLEQVAELAATWPDAGDHLADLFARTWYEMLITQAVQRRPSLATFSSEAHQRTIATFRDSDTLTFKINRVQLAHAHWKQLPRHAAGGQLGILQREFVKKRRHLPIRRLIEQAGSVIQTIKPVFMMSPLSIAQYLPPDTITFDLVIFDEASQVRPVEALGAIMRGRQVVVVGDSKQLPPTNFFHQMVEADSDEESPTSDLESVLGLFVAQGAPQRMLRWHYRSRHESLIAVSNYEFYDNRLVIFPSPDAAREELGLVFHHLHETTYDRGKSRTNPEEARIVAEAVMAHARTQPEHTLGVAAFSASQMSAIQDALELLRRQDDSCEHFFNAHPHEPFFVKNLENVQGDERDVIFISVGYGRDHNGKVTMNFGPINQDGGERRLNVLTTRARQRCEIFTNITDEDIDLNRTDARGVAAFKRYLKYARTGELEMATVTGGGADSPFEEAVAAALRDVGYQPVHQVGSAGFSIDLAIRDPQRPGRYLLGIECDGATYHSAQSARDRDRLRQQVLEGMGWHIHRIWSTDWFRNPERELRRTVTAIQAVQAQSPAGNRGASTANKPAADDSIERHAPQPVEPEPLVAAPYKVTRLSIRNPLPLHEVPLGTMASWIQKVVEVESPVHWEDVTRRILDASSVSRMGSRIRSRLNEALQYAEHRGMVKRTEEFLWKPTGTRTVAVRSHAGLSDFNRQLERIAPEELRLAVLNVVEHSFGMPREEIPAAVCGLLGYGRTSKSMRRHIDKRVDSMLRNGDLTRQGDFIQVNS